MIDGIEFIHTNEIGKLKRVDPLGITNLRIRGMWNIENPKDKDKKLVEENPFLQIENIKIKNPDNSANLIDAILIHYHI